MNDGWKPKTERGKTMLDLISLLLSILFLFGLLCFVQNSDYFFEAYTGRPGVIFIMCVGSLAVGFLFGFTIPVIFLMIKNKISHRKK